MFGFSDEYEDLHLFIRHWTEPQRFYMSCFPRRFPFFFLKQHILISRYSVTSAVTTTSISPVIKWQFCIQASRFSWFFFHCRLLFSSAGHSSPGFLSHLFPPFEVLSWSASGRVRRVVCVRRNGEYGREEFSISCRKFLINFVKSVLFFCRSLRVATPSITVKRGCYYFSLCQRFTQVRVAESDYN